MVDEPLAGRLATWAASLSLAEVPAPVVSRARWLIADQVGVQLRGSTLPNVAPVARLVASMIARPECVVVGSGTRTTVAYAAYANGTFGHACQYDDSHQKAWHPGSCVVPPALAFAERDGRSGRDVLVAVLAGTQVMSLLGAAMTPGMQRVGWHGAKVLGVLGAAVAAGLMLRLPVGQLAQAIAIAASEASGTMEYDHGGGEVKRLHAGAAARSGCQAALLAADGMTAPLTALDGAKGLLSLIGGIEPAAARAEIDAAWDQWHVVDLIFRLHPTVGTVHAPLDALAALREVHGFAWREVDEIRVGMGAYAIGHGGTLTRPTDVVSAQYSLAYSVGLLLVRGEDRPQDYFDPQLWRDPDVLSVADRVRPYALTFPDDVPMLSARVDVRLVDGREFGLLQQGFRGHPTNPASAADLEAKFGANLADIRTAGESDELLALLHRLDDVDDLSRLYKLLIAAPGG